MITNLHTHTTFSDGKNTPEEIVLTALEQGFCSIGFSDHAYTSYDISYCMNDEKGYIKEVRRLQEKYKKEIEIYYTRWMIYIINGHNYNPQTQG